MKEYCQNYYKEEGCCLTCPDKHSGCLCYECKCKKCFYYSNDGYGTGYCDIKSNKKVKSFERECYWNKIEEEKEKERDRKFRAINKIPQKQRFLK